MASSDQRYSLIRQWLQHLSAESTHLDVVSAPELQLLDILREASIAREEHALRLVMLSQQAASEYEAEANRLDSILSVLGLNSTQRQKTLSPSTLRTLSDIAHCCVELDIDDVTQANLVLALSDLHLHAHKAATSVEEERRSSALASSALRNAERKLSFVESQIQVAKEHMTKQEALDYSRSQLFADGYFEEKCQSYVDSVKANAAAIRDTGMCENLEQSSIINAASQLQRYNKEIEKLQDQVRCMMDLPPDLALARVKVEERRLELQSLQQQILQITDVAALGLIK